MIDTDRLLETLADQASEICHQESIIRALRAQNADLQRPALHLTALDVVRTAELSPEIAELTRKLRRVG